MITRLFRRGGRTRDLLRDYRHPTKPVSDLGAAGVTIVLVLILMGAVGIVAAGLVTMLVLLPLNIELAVLCFLALAVAALCIWGARY